MAKMQTEGMTRIAEELDKLGAKAGEVADKMLLAGAKHMVSQWKYGIKKHKHLKTGGLINSITHDPQSSQENDIKMINIYAAGNSGGKRKTANSVKAFMTNYGTSRQKGSHWVQEAEEKGGYQTTKKMTEIWDEFLKGGDAE